MTFPLGNPQDRCHTTLLMYDMYVGGHVGLVDTVYSLACHCDASVFFLYNVNQHVVYIVYVIHIYIKPSPNPKNVSTAFPFWSC